MRSLVYLVATSADGRIAGPAGEVDFFPLPDDVRTWLCADYPETLPTHARAAFGVDDAPNRRFDTVVMGRGTYEPALAAGIPSPYAHLRQVVVSRTLTASGEPGAPEVVAADPVGLVRRLKTEDGLDVWLAGGSELAGVLADEIDALVVKRYPVLVGAGLPLLAGTFAPAALAVTGHRSFADGTQVTWYARG